MQERIETRKVEEALRRLEVHHDALRLRYARNAKGWTQQLLEEGVRNFELGGSVAGGCFRERFGREGDAGVLLSTRKARH